MYCMFTTMLVNSCASTSLACKLFTVNKLRPTNLNMISLWFRLQSLWLCPFSAYNSLLIFLFSENLMYNTVILVTNSYTDLSVSNVFMLHVCLCIYSSWVGVAEPWVSGVYSMFWCTQEPWVTHLTGPLHPPGWVEVSYIYMHSYWRVSTVYVLALHVQCMLYFEMCACNT